MTQLFTYQVTVKDEWLDHNNHMNDAEYNRVFSNATDEYLAYLGLSEAEIERRHYTVFTLENHETYQKEVNKDEVLTVTVQLVDHDAKRLHAFMTLYDQAQDVCATYEVMLMGIDTDSGRPAPFPEDIAQNIEQDAELVDKEGLDQPKELGRQIGIKRKK